MLEGRFLKGAVNVGSKDSGVNGKVFMEANK